MDFSNIKLPITIIGIVVLQAFGLIWYAAQLDSTVKNLEVAVAEMKASMTDTSIAVLKTDVKNLKEKLDAIKAPAEFNADDLWWSIGEVEARIDELGNIEIPETGFTGEDADDLRADLDGNIAGLQTKLDENVARLEDKMTAVELAHAVLQTEVSEIDVSAGTEGVLTALELADARLVEMEKAVALLNALMEADFNKTLKNGGLKKGYNQLKESEEFK